MKAAEIEMRKRIMVRIPDRYGEEYVSIMNPDLSDGIHVTASVESQYRLIPQNPKMKEENNMNNTKVNALKSSARMNQCAKSFANFLPTSQMT